MRTLFNYTVNRVKKRVDEEKSFFIEERGDAAPAGRTVSIRNN